MVLPSDISVLCHHTFKDCSQLTSIHLPDNLTTISIRTFEGCSKLTSIEASSFSTTTFHNKNGALKELLVQSGFSTVRPDNILQNRSLRPPPIKNIYFDVRNWARTRGVDGRLPILSAAARSLKWNRTKQIFGANMPSIVEVDGSTGLPPFMLAAVGSTSDIESVYNLLREYPPAIGAVDCEPRRSSFAKGPRKREGIFLSDGQSSVKLVRR